MRTDIFMATVAQVIPTLAIALSIELGVGLCYFLAKQPAREFEQARSGMISMAIGVGINQVVGELAALSALLFRYPGWTVWIPVALAGISVLYALGGLVLIPVNQLRMMPKPVRPRRQRRRR